MSAAIIDNLSDQELDLLVERGDTGPPRDDPKRNDDSMDRLRTAFSSCNIQAVADGEVTTTTAAPATAPPETAPATTAAATTAAPASSTPTTAAPTTAAP